MSQEKRPREKEKGKEEETLIPSPKRHQLHDSNLESEPKPVQSDISNLESEPKPVQSDISNLESEPKPVQSDIQGSYKATNLVPLMRALRESPSLRHEKFDFFKMTNEERMRVLNTYEEDIGSKHRYKIHVPLVDLNKGPNVACEEIGKAAMEYFNQVKGEEYTYWKAYSILWRVKQDRFHFNFLANHISKEPRYFFCDVGVGDDGKKLEVFCCEPIQERYITYTRGDEDYIRPCDCIIHPNGPDCDLCDEVAGLYACLDPL